MKKTILLFAGLALLTMKTQAQTVIDYDGNVYDTVHIGTQAWLKQNLKVTHYSNGDAIPIITSNNQWTLLSSGARCYYDNDSATNKSIYGGLYNWYAVNDSRNICPTGWHVPTDSEWKTLEVYLGMSQLASDATGWRGTTEGGKLKESGYTHWLSPNTGASNISNFTALPGGYRSYTDGSYTVLSYNAEFWSSTQYDNTRAYDRELWYNNATAYRGYWSKNYGIAVRCIMDTTTTMLNDINNNYNIKIYPNPAIDRVSIDCADRNSFKMQVYNVVGACVLQRQLSNGTNDIDISFLTTGIYVIQLISADETFQQKLIKE